MQHRHHIRGDLIMRDHRSRRITLDETDAAQILADEKTGIEIGVMDRRRQEAALM